MNMNNILSKFKRKPVESAKTESPVPKREKNDPAAHRSL